MNYYNLQKTGREVDRLLNAVAELQASAVKFTSQGLSDDDKAQARNNIGAVSSDYVVEAVSNQISAYVSSTAFTEAVSDIIVANITSGLSLATIGYVRGESRPSFLYVSSTTGVWNLNKIYVVPMDGQNKLWVQTDDGKKEISVVQNAVSTYTPDGCMVTFTPNGFSLGKTQLDPTIWSYTNGVLSNKTPGNTTSTGTAISTEGSSGGSGWMNNFDTFASVSGKYYLTRSLDFTVLGTKGSTPTQFTGTFNGNNYAITFPSDSYKMFDSVAPGATIQNLTIIIPASTTEIISPIFGDVEDCTFKNCHILVSKNTKVKAPLFGNCGIYAQFYQCSISGITSTDFVNVEINSSSSYGTFCNGLYGTVIENCFANIGITGDSVSQYSAFVYNNQTMQNYSIKNNVIWLNQTVATTNYFIYSMTSSSSSYATQNIYAINATNKTILEAYINSSIIRGDMPQSGAYLGQIMYNSNTGRFMIWNGTYWQYLT